MELYESQTQLKVLHDELEEYKSKLNLAAREAANATRDYEKKLALILIQLRNGVEFEYEGEKVVDPPVSVMERIAKGITADLKANADIQESLFSNLKTKISMTQSQALMARSLLENQTQLGG
jgi:hypothetical protein